MSNNPPVDVEQQPPQKPHSVFWIRINWFAIGFLVCLLLWSFIRYASQRAGDHSHLLSKAIRKYPPGWIDHSRAITVGRFTLITSAKDAHAGSLVLAGPNGFPSVFYMDLNSNGRVENIDVIDAANAGWAFTDKDEDGEFDYYSYNRKRKEREVFFVDNNADGIFDERIVVQADKENEFSVKIDCQWHEVTLTDEKGYVEIDGKRIEVEADNGSYRLVE